MSDLINVSAESQNGQILSWLERGKSITPIDALSMFGCFRLSARVWDLRDYGWPVQKVIEQKNGRRYARYYLPKEMKK